MYYEKIELKEVFPFLVELGSVAEVEVYVQEPPCEMYEAYKKPAMIVLPGSGYEKCTRREAEPVAIRLMAMDFNVFVLTYSCSPVRYPVQLIETAALFNLIDQNADEWNTDINRIGVMGFSAGGHLAAHYSAEYGCGEIKEYFDKAYRPCGTVLCYPVISADKTILNTDSFEMLLGHHPEGDEVKKFSCEYLVTENTPPAFIWHTAEDNCVFVENSLRYALALSRNKVPYTMHIYPFGEHGLSTADELTNNNRPERELYCGEWMAELEKWAKIFFK